MKRLADGFPYLSRFADVLPGREAQEPILGPTIAANLLEWLTEIWEEEALTEAGLGPRRRALFHGPPGTGKTTLAHHLAGRLGLPLAIVHSEQVLGKYMNEAAQNLAMLFSAARPKPKGEGPVVLFFDEFEALAPSRKSGGERTDAEMNRTVATLLRQIDAHEGFVIAATNLSADIDPAIWRRFDIHILLDVPGQRERERILARYLAPWGMPAGELSALAMAVETASPALMRALCESIKRSIVIGPKLGWDMRREAVVQRAVDSVDPHPDLGKPRLWSKGAQDPAVARMTWPLLTAKEAEAVGATPRPDPMPGDSVVTLRPKGSRS